jgi:beta-mannanase
MPKKLLIVLAILFVTVITVSCVKINPGGGGSTNSSSSFTFIGGRTNSFSPPAYTNQYNTGVYWGVFEEGLQNNMPEINFLEAQAGKKLATVMWYIDWSTANGNFPASSCEALYSRGILPYITWETWDPFGNWDIKHQTILSGTWDSYLEKFGRDAGAWGKPVIIRWGHEMNMGSYPWCFNANGNSVQSYINAYRYVWEKVVQSGGSNIIWLWCPHHWDNIAGTVYTMTNAYPGDSYADWVGFDAYNWCDESDGNPWYSVSDTFGEAYRLMQIIAPDKPIIIGEMGTGSNPTAGIKAAWISNFFDSLNSQYSNVRAVVWFNTNKEKHWKYNNSADELAAFTNGLNRINVQTDGTNLAVYFSNFVRK